MFKLFGKHKFVIRIISLVIFMTLSTFGSYIVHADESGPTVSEFSPSPGGTVTSTTPLFSIRFYDPDMLDSVVVVKVDGQNVTPSIAWEGIYQTYYDSCSDYEYTVRIGDDYTKGVVTAQFPRLTVGEHTVYYKLKDRAGKFTEGTYIFSIVDSEGPQIVERSPASGATINAGYPTIMVKLNDANNVDASSIVFSLDNTTVTPTYDIISRTLTYKPPNVLLNGSHSISLTVKDEFDNSTSASWNFIVKDNSAPSISGLTPSNNGMVGSAMPMIGAILSDSSGIKNPVTIVVDGTSHQVDWNPLTNKVSYLSAAPLAEGRHTVSLTVADQQSPGNSNTVNWSFLIDQTGPAVSNFYPAAGSTIEILRPRLSLRFEDPAMLDTTVVFKVDGNIIPTSILWDGIYETYEDSCSGPYTVRVGDDFTKGEVTALCPQLTQGEHTFEYIVKDRLGNTTASSYKFYIYEQNGPQLVSCYPANGATIGAGLPTITATLQDGNNIVPSSVSMLLNGQTVSASYSASTRTVSYTPAQSLTNGAYSVTVSAKDELNNLATHTWSFIVNDTAPPTFSNLVPADNSVINNFTPTIEAKISDPSGIKSPVTLKIDNDTLQIPYNPSTGKASYIPTAPLNSGYHTVTLTATDNQNQTGSVTWKFYVDKAGPELSVVSPVAGESVTTINPKITVRFFDPSQFNASKTKMILDGTLVTPTIAWDGIYETYYDTCSDQEYQVRVGDDYTKGEISYQASNLANLKQHSVEMTVYDKLGNFRNFAYSFLVHDNVPPVISNLTPVNGSTSENSSLAISAKVTDNNKVDAQSVVMSLNGENVTTSYNSSTGVVTHTPSAPLADGLYTVVVSADDDFGNSRSAQWTFSIRHTGAPQISNVLPPQGSGTRALRPTISAKVTDVRGIDLDNIFVTLDDTALEPVFTPDAPGSVMSGTITAVPTANLSSSMHRVTLTVSDLSGNTIGKSWEFGVNQFGDMGVVPGLNCTDCHNEGIAAIEQRHIEGAINCDLCHVYTVVGSEPDCCYCHEGAHNTWWPPPIGQYACTQCHNADLSWIIPTHGSGMELNKHSYNGFPDDCQRCHSKYLTREHNFYVEGRGVTYDCNTCHKSIRTDVKQAISSQNRACTACHAQSGAGHDQYHEGSLQEGCLDCHKSNISQEHLYNTKTQGEPLFCSTCHNSAKVEVQQAITNKKLDCTACHGQLSDHEAVHESGIDIRCQQCHANTLTKDHIADRAEIGLGCETCHNNSRAQVGTAIADSNKNCQACHNQGHNVILLDEKPTNIPLYDGFLWSTPIPAEIVTGEPWVPSGFARGTMLISNRRSDVTGQQVADFYRTELNGGGWSETSGEITDYTNYRMDFEKDGRFCTILFYQNELADPTSDLLGAGRIQMFY